ncbi:cytochrome b5 type B isoform X2 [Diprion similis]|nr:cytochrome b5 type B isoform X2 [Diprion similis]
MLNVRKLPDAGVQNGGGGARILSITSVEVPGETASTRVVEKFDKQTKKMAKLPSSSEAVDSQCVKLGLTEGATGPTESGSSGESLEAGKELRIISLDEIAWHDTPDDCWFAIYDYVYDCTSFIRDHPGGDDVLLEYAGRDATLAFIGTGHSKFARKSLERYLIGELPHSERIFRIADGVKVFGY